MKRLAKLAPPLALLGLLTGCSQSIVATVSCEVGNHVTVSKHDKLTERTASDIDANNRSRIAGGCPAPKPERVASNTKS